MNLRLFDKVRTKISARSSQSPDRLLNLAGAWRRRRSQASPNLLMIALWWGLVTGICEGTAAFYAHSYIWHDALRAAVIVEPLLFLAVSLLISSLNRSFLLSRSGLLKATFMFSTLALLDCFSLGFPFADSQIRLLSIIAASSMIGLVFFLYSNKTLLVMRWSLPFLLIIAVWYIAAIPIKQYRHEMREVGRLPLASREAQNVVLIVVDTLRADHLPIYGYPRNTSTALSEMASQGVLFENAISPSSWTVPSHASLLTGLYPHAHHMEGSLSYFGWEYPTIGEMFKARGYRTAAFSANTFFFARKRGFGRGFTHFEDAFQSWGSIFVQTYYGEIIEKLLYRLRLKRDLIGRLHAEQINSNALDWIDNGRRPFFLVLNYFDVHNPYLPPEPFLHKYSTLKHPGGRASQNWSWFENLTPQELQGVIDAYDGAIAYVDNQIGKLVEDLKKRGLERNTLIVITSDHGESFNEHGFMNHGNALYRELIHVPLILWAPGRIPGGKRISTPVSLVSLPATMLDDGHKATSPLFPGVPLTALWDGSQGEQRVPDPISELAQLLWNPKFPNYYGPIDSVTDAEWHYIWSAKSGDELYRCCSSGPETLNLARSPDGKRICDTFRKNLLLQKAASYK